MATTEIKNNFLQGKINQDLHPRVLENGQYRDLTNGRAAKSEGSGVGAIENVRGNLSLSSFIDPTAVVIGSIRDQQRNRIYYFVVGQREDGIYEYNEVADSVRVILRSTSRSGVLKFSVDNLITGVNLIGENAERLLFWTDGANPPRRINIERMVSRHQGRLDGVFINEAGERTVDPFTEDEISVIKAPPLNPPSLSAINVVARGEEPDTDDEQSAEENLKDKFIRFAYRWKYIDDEYSTFSPFSDVPFNSGRFAYDRSNGAIISMENLIRSIDISINTGPRDVVEIDLLYIDTTTSIVFVVESFNKENEEWRDNFDLRPRLGEDAVDFTETPINFSNNKLYRPLPSRELERIFDDVPRFARSQDIIENRLVYGDYTTRYNIEDLRKEVLRQEPVDPEDLSKGFTDTITSVVETRDEIIVDFDARLASNRNEVGDTITDLIGENGEKNLKSDRDYELAIVYGDNVGRRTPPLTARNNVVHVPLDRANKRNSIEVDIKSKAPEWATWYRWYVKNNRTTHYNVIPLETIADPLDPEQFAWFRISEADREKVKVGDHLIIKVSNNAFYTETFNHKTEVRVEEAGIQPANFLETTTPRVDPEDEFSEILTLQRAGYWMKIRNTEDFIEDITNEDDNSFATESKARSNNTRRFDDYRPIRGRIVDYIDRQNYYPEDTSPDEASDNDDAVFEGTYNPETGGNDQDGTAVLGGEGSGPMRIELEITDPNGTGSGTHFTYNYWINPTPAQGGTGNSKGFYPEIRRITTDIAITASSINLVNGAKIRFKTTENWFPGDRLTVVYRRAQNFLWRYETSSPNRNGKKPLNGRTANVVLPVNMFHSEDESIYGNSIVQFGVEDGLNSGRGGSPLSGRAISMPFEKNVFQTNSQYYPNIEEWLFEEGLWHPNGTGDKKIIGTNRDGDPIGLSHIGFWRGIPTLPRSGAATTEAALIAAGVAGFVGTGAGVAVASTLATFAAQAGVAGVSLGPAGLAIAGAAIVVAGLVAVIGSLFGNRPGEGDQWRIISGSGMIEVATSGDGNGVTRVTMEDGTFEYYGADGVKLDNGNTFQASGAETTKAAENTAYPLYMIVNSGAYNHKRNKNAKDIRMKSAWNYVQGNIDSQASAQAAKVIFETIPEISVLDEQVFYESYGDTLPCLNGIHFGEEMGNAQLITFINQAGEEIQGNAQAAFDAYTETGKVTPITVPVRYWNCIAFDNGVESMTIRDEYGTPELSKGVKAANIVDEYEEVRNFSGLIYSGPYVDTTGINRLNEFSSFHVGNRTIVKDLDENYGPIRRVYAENTDLIVFQEDKVSIVQVDKNALFNADGSSNVASSSSFLNQTIALPGEYGIGNNPESFAVYGHVKYWADRHRGVILQMEGKQIAEISDFGMRDFFRDNLAENELVLGYYDDYHDQYLVTMREPFLDPSVIAQNLPLLISKQGFLSRNDACRFPQENLQFQRVYEFYEDTSPGEFTVGDIIYGDLERTSVFNGDDDWFVTREREQVEVTQVSAFGSDTAKFDFGDIPLQNVLNVGQRIEMVNRDDVNTIYNATISQVSEGTLYARFNTTPTGLGNDWDLTVEFDFVVNIDNFGVVRRKLDCLTVPPLNHDAFRASLYGYSSAAEACANGLVGQILYHNGDDATPDVGDSIYDSPYGSDEYVEVYQLWLDDFPYNTGDKVVFNNSTWQAIQEVTIGIIPGDTEGGSDAFWVMTEDPVQYKQGRTQKRGWYQIFDGADFEDYVIRILQGKVVEKRRCAAIAANRRSIAVGGHFIRREDENEVNFASRVCRSIPGNEAFHDGDNVLPVAGDVLYQDEYTDNVFGQGSYPIAGGYYVSVNEDGTIFEVLQCYTRVCLTELLNVYGPNNGVFNDQLRINDNKFTFKGVIDEAIYGSTNRQSVPGVTIRWTAKGSQRYPLNTSDFYELNLPDGLNPDQVVTLTNTEFAQDSVNETALQYTILEFCYNRNLVPQNVAVTYYNDGGEEYVVGQDSTKTWLNATSTDPASLFFTDTDPDESRQHALDLWEFLTGDTVLLADYPVPGTPLNSVAREDFRFTFGFHTSPLLTSGSAIQLFANNSDEYGIIFTSTSGPGTLFQFPNAPQANSNDIIQVTSGGIPDCVDEGVTYTYPSGDAASVIARIFDLTGNQCTGTVEVSDEIYFDRTAITRRQYFTDDALTTPLNGWYEFTNTAFLDSRVIDGETRYGAWWAFGPTDNAAATDAYLIDENGYVLDGRTRDLPFDVFLYYSQTSELAACSSSTGESFIADNDDFLDVTNFAALDGSIPPAGYYAWLDNNDTPAEEGDDQRIIRYWNGSDAFDTSIYPSGADNCPVALEGTSVFYSTNEQTAVCSSGSLTTVYFHIGSLTAGSATIYTNPFGPRSASNSALPPGFLQTANRSTTYTWDGSTLTENNVACIIYCTDPDATNTDEPGDCKYPSYCPDNRYEEYPDGTINPKHNPDTDLCLTLLPAYEPRFVTASTEDNVTGCAGQTGYTTTDPTITRTRQQVESFYQYADGSFFPADSLIMGDSFGVTGGSISALTGWRSDPGDPLTVTTTFTPNPPVINVSNATILTTFDGSFLSNTPQDVILDITPPIAPTTAAYNIVLSEGSKVGDPTTDRVLPGENYLIRWTLTVTHGYRWKVNPTILTPASIGTDDTASIGVTGTLDDCATTTLVVPVVIGGEIEAIPDVAPVCTDVGPSATLSGDSEALADGIETITLTATNIMYGVSANCTDHVAADEAVGFTPFYWNLTNLQINSGSIVSGCGPTDTTCVFTRSSAISGDAFFSVTNEIGEIGTSNAHSVTFTAPAAPMVGCMDVNADNYDSTADTAGTCYYEAQLVADAASDTLACDGFNSGSIDAARQQYVTSPSATYGNGLQIYRKTSGTGASSVYTEGGNGWFTNNGFTVWQQTDGLISNYQVAGCPQYPRVSNFRFTTQPPDVSTNEEFVVRLRWDATAAPDMRWIIRLSSPGIQGGGAFGVEEEVFGTQAVILLQASSSNYDNARIEATISEVDSLLTHGDVTSETFNVSGGGFGDGGSGF